MLDLLLFGLQGELSVVGLGVAGLGGLVRPHVLLAGYVTLLELPLDFAALLVQLRRLLAHDLDQVADPAARLCLFLIVLLQ